MTRALVSDAAFTNKAREGREDEIRPCIFDNFCWGQVHAGKPIAEFHNPHLGERGEADWAPDPAARPRRVAVVGAGPAGLEAAWTAAARIHEVHRFGTGSATGGELYLEARLPEHADIAKVVDHQPRMIENVDTVVYATPRRVEDTVTPALADFSRVLIGGCLAPRIQAIAIHEEHRIGNTS